MKRTSNSHCREGISWDSALALYRDQLAYYLDLLVEADCREGILELVETDVKRQSVPDEFKLGFIVRALIQRVIERMRDHVQSPEAINIESVDFCAPRESLPVMERLVYCMRDMLEYSTRETSLLIGITDAQVEGLLSYARKRLDMYEGPSSIGIEEPTGTYFRWRFVDLHRHCRRTA